MQIGRRVVILRTRITSERVDGRLVGYVVTFDDITDFLAAERSGLADVARRIAHEIKNPLTPIALATDRLKKNTGLLIPAKAINLTIICQLFPAG